MRWNKCFIRVTQEILFLPFFPIPCVLEVEDYVLLILYPLKCQQCLAINKKAINKYLLNSHVYATCPFFLLKVGAPETMDSLSAVHFLFNFGKFKQNILYMLNRHLIIPNYPSTNNCIFSLEKDLWLGALCLDWSKETCMYVCVGKKTQS